jgi:hypothetical protein
MRMMSPGNGGPRRAAAALSADASKGKERHAEGAAATRAPYRSLVLTLIPI